MLTILPSRARRATMRARCAQPTSRARLRQCTTRVEGNVLTPEEQAAKLALTVETASEVWG
jgi:hypothetical protein